MWHLKKTMRQVARFSYNSFSVCPAIIQILISFSWMFSLWSVTRIFFYCRRWFNSGVCFVWSPLLQMPRLCRAAGNCPPPTRVHKTTPKSKYMYYNCKCRRYKNETLCIMFPQIHVHKRNMFILWNWFFMFHMINMIMYLVYYLFLTHFIFQNAQISKFIVHTTGFNFVISLEFLK